MELDYFAWNGVCIKKVRVVSFAIGLCGLKMAVVEGQIEPLKKLKEILDYNDIARFSSIGEINDFIKNYETEKNEISKLIEIEFERELSQLQSDLLKLQQRYEDLKYEVTNELNFKITALDLKLKLARGKSNSSFFHKIFCFPKRKILDSKKANLEKNFKKIVSKQTHLVEKEVCILNEKINDYTTNKDAFISDRCLHSIKELERIKEVVDSLYNLIAGAIGENSVIKEVQKLSDNFHLFNDFSLEFAPPIYDKKTDDRIYSVQIDHLLVCETGIFILETKNWSKQSLKNIDLRSPVKQILRSSYAMFVLLNSQSCYNNINLESHHWGSKQIPVRNLIVMTNAKPKEEFKYVKVLSLKELNSYVTYFDPMFNSDEIKSICDFLRHQNT